jgi:hypothetical protein
MRWLVYRDKTPIRAVRMGCHKANEPTEWLKQKGSSFQVGLEGLGDGNREIGEVSLLVFWACPGRG